MSTDNPIETLAAHFTSPERIKKYYGMFSGKRTKATVQLLADAQESGVARAYTLDRRAYDGNLYFIKAVSTRGDLDAATLAELVREATLLPLGVLRYEGMCAPRLPYPISSDDEARVIHDLSRPEDGILVYPVSIISSKKGDHSHAFWALSKDGQYSVEAISDKKL